MQIALLDGSPAPRSRARAIARVLAGALEAHHPGTRVTNIDIAGVSGQLFVESDATVSELVHQVMNADLVLIASPVATASYTGLLKAFLDLLPSGGLTGVPVLTVVAGESEADALSVTSSLRRVLNELGAAARVPGLSVGSDQMDHADHIVARWMELHAAALDELLPVGANPTGSSEGINIDTDHLRQVVGGFCSGITVITGEVDRGPVGMTCQSFISLSLTPPLIAFSPQLTSTSYPRLRQAGHLCVNILAESQQALGWQFARSGTDKFAGVPWAPAGNGAPLLDGTVGTIECVIVDEQVIGDHYLVVARVTALHHTPDRRPLLFFRSAFNAIGEVL